MNVTDTFPLFGGQASNPPRRPWLDALALATLCAAFFATWWNLSLSPVLAGNLVGASLARMPYRDYYMSAPPGALLLDRAIGMLFGARLIAFWAVGALLQIAAAVVLFRWLCRHFRRWTSGIAVLTALIASAGDIADTPLFYHHVTMCIAVFAGVQAMRSIETTGPRAIVHAFLAGLFAAGLLMFRMPAGLMIPFALAVLGGGLLLASGRVRQALLSLGAAAVGVAVVLVPTVAWLVQEQAWQPALEQIFTKGPSSKGGAVVSLLRPATLTIADSRLLLSAMIALAVVLVAAAGYARSPAKSRWRAASLAASAALIAAAALSLGKAATMFDDFGARSLPLAACFLVQIGCLAMGAWALIDTARSRATRRSSLILVLAGFAFACAYSEAISWPAYEPMLLPGLAIVLVIALDHPPWGRGIAGALPIVAACLVLIGISQSRKQDEPASWGRWVEPPLELSTRESTLPQFAGFRISPSTEGFLSKVTHLIQENSAPGDSLFTYPNLPLFYALADRWPPTFALTHWVDVCPDYVAEADARRLLESPPKVMVIHEESDGEIADEEGLFRDGHRSAVRAVRAAVETLKPRYRLLAVFEVPGYPTPVTVWTLPAPVPAPTTAAP